jgi:hypothetical protein
MVNGVLYLGVELLYQYFAHSLFHEEIANPELGLMSHITSFKSLMKLGVSWWFSFLHFWWTLGTYLVTFILSLIWVQELFDYLMAEKLKELKSSAD